jgi:hypothetical protein
MGLLLGAKTAGRRWCRRGTDGVPIHNIISSHEAPVVKWWPWSSVQGSISGAWRHLRGWVALPEWSHFLQPPSYQGARTATAEYTTTTSVLSTYFWGPSRAAVARKGFRAPSGVLTQQQHQLDRNVSSTSESPVGGSRSNLYIVTQLEPPSYQGAFWGPAVRRWQGRASERPVGYSRSNNTNSRGTLVPPLNLLLLCIIIRVSSGRLTQQSTPPTTMIESDPASRL